MALRYPLLPVAKPAAKVFFGKKVALPQQENQFTEKGMNTYWPLDISIRNLTGYFINIQKWLFVSIEWQRHGIMVACHESKG